MPHRPLPKRVRRTLAGIPWHEVAKLYERNDWKLATGQIGELAHPTPGMLLKLALHLCYSLWGEPHPAIRSVSSGRLVVGYDALQVSPGGHNAFALRTYRFRRLC